MKRIKKREGKVYWRAVNRGLSHLEAWEWVERCKKSWKSYAIK